MEAAAVVCPPKFYIVHRDGLRTGDADKKYDVFDDDDDDGDMMLMMVAVMMICNCYIEGRNALQKRCPIFF